jgi:hypothetical protein
MLAVDWGMDRSAVICTDDESESCNGKNLRYKSVGNQLGYRKRYIKHPQGKDRLKAYRTHNKITGKFSNTFHNIKNA